MREKIDGLLMNYSHINGLKMNERLLLKRHLYASTYNKTKYMCEIKI